MKAYHFLRDNNTLLDGRKAPRVNTWLKHPDDEPLVICKSGLHASIKPMDALNYAPGSLLCRVEVRGEILQKGDKLVARERKILWKQDAAPMLRAFARRRAADVAHLWNPPEVVLEYLRTGDEKLRDAAWDVAWDVAHTAGQTAEWNAAWNAARAAAWDASRYAALHAALYAARYAAWAAARDAAWAAAQTAARDGQNELLEAYIRDMRRGVTYWEIDV